MDATNAMEMEQLVAAFNASVTMSGNNNRAVPPPAAHPAHMEELVATFAASLTMSGNVHDPAALPHAYQETDGATAADDGVSPKGEEEACVLRVRFPDGSVHCRSFDAARPTAALYQYCRSVLCAGGAHLRGWAFRLVRLAGGASDEVRDSSSTSLRDLGLHHCTLHVVLI
ncbi:unnamed protein product [Alopecurus aequalis]